MEEITKLKWWGYKHVNGSLQVKRYFDYLDLQEARESDLVEVTVGPFLASGREEALEKLKESLF